MSTDSSQFEVVSTNGSSASDNDNSSRTAMYEELVRNPKFFWDTLWDFLESSSKNYKIPIVDGNSLDLHRLFNEVTSRGGLQKVIEDCKCKEVIDAFNFETTVTNAACVLRDNYRKMLFEFEHLYYFQAPPSTFWAKEKALKRLVQKSVNRDIDPQELKPGVVVTGNIDGKFESGYLVTVKMGSEELKGVLYHIPQAPPETQRRKNKKAKTSQGDSQRPKCPRTGYNFFFSEQHARLKAENGGQKGSFTKDIVNMWSNLSESDRKVYQERSLEDAKRYKMEMLQHRSSIDSCAVETVAVTDAAASTSASETRNEASQ